MRRAVVLRAQLPGRLADNPGWTRAHVRFTTVEIDLTAGQTGWIRVGSGRQLVPIRR